MKLPRGDLELGNRFTNRPEGFDLVAAIVNTRCFVQAWFPTVGAVVPVWADTATLDGSSGGGLAPHRHNSEPDVLGCHRRW
jgi:hypothetical protein